MSYSDDIPVGKIVAAGGGLLVLIAGLATLFLWGCPKYNMYQKELDGKAELLKAESTRRTTVLEAQARMDAAKMLAQAEIERAKGVAEANRIVAESLKGHDEYLRYLWIDKLAEGTQREVIYVPTEASLPILEAGRGIRVEK